VAYVSKTLSVYFYAVEPFPMEGHLGFQSGALPMDKVMATLRAMDPASEDYRIPETMFGGETFCLLHDDGPQPVLGAYFKDDLSRPFTEYKGEISELMLREGEGLVDAAYAAFFPNDVIGLVRTSSKSPGFAKLGQWLTLATGYGCFLMALRDHNVLEQLDRDPGKLTRLILGLRKNRIASVEQYSPSVAQALRTMAEANELSDDVELGWSARYAKNRAAWSQQTRQLIEELLGILPDFEKAQVKVTGRRKPFNLLRTSIQTSVPVALIDTKRVGTNEAATALFKAYEEEKNSIAFAIRAMRGPSGDGDASPPSQLG
jgi:hypothetical protein